MTVAVRSYAKGTTRTVPTASSEAARSATLRVFGPVSTGMPSTAGAPREAKPDVRHHRVEDDCVEGSHGDAEATALRRTGRSRRSWPAPGPGAENGRNRRGPGSGKGRRSDPR